MFGFLFLNLLACSSETDKETADRLKKDKVRKADTRSSETSEETADRLKKDKTSKANTRRNKTKDTENIAKNVMEF